MKEFEIFRSESESENYFPVVIGVEHKIKRIDEILELLNGLDLKNKRVMIEVSDYPIPEKYQVANLEFCKFFEAVAEKIIQSGGTVLCGDNEILIDRAAKELEKMWREGFSVYLCGYHEAVTLERDPFFLQFAIENKPDLIILDTIHAEYIALNIGLVKK